MIAVLFTGFVKAENQEEYLKVAKAHAALSLKDAGCVRFDVLEPRGEEVRFVEIWESRECLDAHAKRSASGKEAPEMNRLRYGKQMDVFSIL